MRKTSIELYPCKKEEISDKYLIDWLELLNKLKKA
jgi:hypothetical protein